MDGMVHVIDQNKIWLASVVCIRNKYFSHNNIFYGMHLRTSLFIASKISVLISFRQWLILALLLFSIMGLWVFLNSALDMID